MSDLAHEAAAGLLEEVASEADVATVDETVEQPETPEYEFPSFAADTEGIEDLLEPEPEPEPEFTYQPEAEEEEPVWDDDDEKRKLKSELAKLQKKVAWESEQRVKVSEKNWREEASRRFPLADVAEINATSRRQMLAKAAEQHTRYAKKLEPFTEALELLKSQAVAEVKAEARVQAAEAWGRPTSGPSVPVVNNSEEDEKLARGNYRTFQERTLAMLKAGKYNI